jgi:hypothetical protein
MRSLLVDGGNERHWGAPLGVHPPQECNGFSGDRGQADAAMHGECNVIGVTGSEFGSTEAARRKGACLHRQAGRA